MHSAIQMSDHPVRSGFIQSGFIQSGQAKLWYETAGRGTPMIFLHAGVADSRQWNHEFAVFQGDYQVIRYDLRGFGQSEPVDEAFSHLNDLRVVLKALEIEAPAIFMGCSMGGSLALDFALEHPECVAALVMSGSGPNGLKLDVPRPKLFDAIKAADERGDIEQVAELETQLWFDGEGRHPDTIDPDQRAIAFDMNRLALAHEAKGLGRREPDVIIPATDRIDQLRGPLLVVVGAHDIPFIHGAADFLLRKCRHAKHVGVVDTAHLANMDRPEGFEGAVRNFLRSAGL